MSTPPASRAGYAVFDVDETLIRCKSMFAFLNFCYSEMLGAEAGGAVYIEFTEQLFALAERVPRNDVNRAFYRVFKGWRRATVDRLAQDWFAQELALGLWYDETLAALRRHQQQGDKIVLLSGSADFILAPLASWLKVDHLLAIHIEQTPGGILSGEIAGIQTIGAGKCEALEQLLAGCPANPVLHGYGDHESDLPFLARCDHRTVVLSDPAQRQAPAWSQGWPTLAVEHRGPRRRQQAPLAA